MKPKQTRMRVFSGAHLRGCLKATAVAASLAFCGAAAQASPILDGDVDLIVSIAQPSDCPGCTSHELDVLERGVGMMLTEMKNTAINTEVCIAEASLAKDLAVLTFDAYRSGAISESRWRDSLRYKGRFAGRLTQFTIDAMLLSYREAIEERLGVEIPPSSVMALQIDIYASAQLARIFDRLAAGDWRHTWLSALRADASGLHPVVDTILTLDWPGRSVFDEILIYSRVDAHWREHELARITGLQPDFLVGTIEADRDQLLIDYRVAMITDPWTTLVAGCGSQAAEGFRRHAIALSQGIQSIALPNKQNNPGNVMHQDPGSYGLGWEHVDVFASLPPVVINDGTRGIFSGVPPGALAPGGVISFGGSGGHSSGGGGSTSGTTLGETISDVVLGDTSPLRCEMDGGVLVYITYSNGIAKIEKLVFGGIAYVAAGVGGLVGDLSTALFRLFPAINERITDGLDMPSDSWFPITQAALNGIERYFDVATSDFLDENCERISP